MKDVAVSSPFAAAFADAVETRGMSLTSVQQSLRDRGVSVSLATLSYWRSGARVPNREVQREAIAELESMLDLPTNALADLAVRTQDPQTDLASGIQFATMAEVRDPIENFREAERVLQAPWSGQFRELSVVNTVDVGPDGYPGNAQLELVLQCLTGVMTRVMHGVVSPGGGASQFDVEVIDGGTMIERYNSPDDTLVAISIELERPVAAGDTALISGRLGIDRRQAPSRRTAIGVHRQARKVMNWVRFHPEAIPDWIREVSVAAGQESFAFRGLDTDNAVHQLRWDFGPGSLGLDWGYGELIPSEHSH